MENGFCIPEKEMRISEFLLVQIAILSARCQVSQRKETHKNNHKLNEIYIVEEITLCGIQYAQIKLQHVICNIHNIKPNNTLFTQPFQMKTRAVKRVVHGRSTILACILTFPARWCSMLLWFASDGLFFFYWFPRFTSIVPRITTRKLK